MNPSPAADWIEDVYRFWFEDVQPEQWFRADPALDAAIKARFNNLHATLNAEPVVVSEAREAVARVIVLDQFSRNMFRGTPSAFASDPLALEIAGRAIAAGLDRGLSANERTFLYLPFEHSEDPALQRRSVALFSALGGAQTLDYAQQHAAIIARFGRFPHRNAVLGRDSTAEEIAFLKTSPGFG